jgi:lysozyme
MKQSGLIPTYPKPEDYVMGGETAIKRVKRTKDWKPYAPALEKQYGLTFDTLSCTSFSFCNVAEFQVNYMIANKELSPEALKWLTDEGYIDSDGKVNFSDKYVAIGSGTTERGNDGRTVAEFVRTNGLIPEKDLPLGEVSTQKEYLNSAQITPAMRAKGKLFLKYVKVQWEWLFFDSNAGFNEDLQVNGTIEEAPIMLGITTPATHMTCLYGYDHDTTNFKVFDTYEPFYFENVGSAYNPQIGIRLILTPNKPEVSTDIDILDVKTFTFKNKLVYGSKGEDVKMLQRVLIQEGFLKVGLVTGNFLNQTRSAVKNLQMFYGITPTGNVGNITMAKLNEILLMSLKKKLEISNKGLELIKAFEGCILHPYQDQVGYWTIGWGNRYVNGIEVSRETPSLTQAQADELLKQSVKTYEKIVRSSVKVDLTQNQYDALVSFCYNLGNISGLKDKINNGTLNKTDFMKYVHAKGKVLQGLVSRRQAEADYYFK